MSEIPCPDGCGRTYQSIKAATLCQCDQYDPWGYEKPQGR